VEVAVAVVTQMSLMQIYWMAVVVEEIQLILVETSKEQQVSLLNLAIAEHTVSVSMVEKRVIILEPEAEALLLLVGQPQQTARLDEDRAVLVILLLSVMQLILLLFYGQRKQERMLQMQQLLV
jgi:hypothetical protein